MKSDKQLIREGRYQEALGGNFHRTPLYLIDNTDPNNPVCHEPIHDNITDVEQQALELGISSFFIGNINADWL